MTPGARELTSTEIEDLAAGAWILGAGGGGNPYHSLLTLRAEAARGFRPVVILAHSIAATGSGTCKSRGRMSLRYE